MDWHNGAGLGLRVLQDEVAPFLAVFDKPGALQGANYLPRGQGRKLRHGSGGNRERNRHPALEGLAFFGDRFTVGGQALQV